MNYIQYWYIVEEPMGDTTMHLLSLLKITNGTPSMTTK